MVCHILAQLKASVCADWPVLIFSDGRDAELALCWIYQIVAGFLWDQVWQIMGFGLFECPDCFRFNVQHVGIFSRPHARNLAPWSAPSAFVCRSTECGNRTDRTRNTTPKLSAPAIKHILKRGILHKNC